MTPREQLEHLRRRVEFFRNRDPEGFYRDRAPTLLSSGRPDPRARSLPYTSATDAGAIDANPDDCWRCDALPASTAVGLCSACLTYLRDDHA